MGLQKEKVDMIMRMNFFFFFVPKREIVLIFDICLYLLEAKWVSKKKK